MRLCYWPRGRDLVIPRQAERSYDDVRDAVGGVEDVDCVGEGGEVVDGCVAQSPFQQC